MRARPAIAALLVASLAAVGCTDDDDDDGEAAVATTTTTAPAATTPTEPLAAGTLDQVELTTTEVAELDEPVAFAARSSTPDLYVAERSGRVRLIKVTPPPSGPGTGPDRYQLQSTPVLDLSRSVMTEGAEQGLLGLAFSSDGRTLYVDYTAQPDGRTVVAEYALGDRASVDVDSRRELLTVEQPQANHNGGHLVLGPDGYLYVGLGDGGGTGDPDQRAQDTGQLLGKILRIDPIGGTAELPYGIPAGNPFADGSEGAPEVWLYGVRNPWRFSFDRSTGDLWVADVGQGDWEEVDLLPAAGGFDAGRGANLGWDLMEGTHPFDGENPPGGVLPVHEYSHASGDCSVTGGYVYRGEAIEALRGAYLFADLCATGLRGVQVDRQTVVDERTWDLPIQGVTSFGQDNDGELFVLLGSGPVLKIGAAP